MRKHVTITTIFLALASISMNAEVSGEKLYASNCAVCHSADGSSNSDASKHMHVVDLRAASVQKQTDAQLYDSIARGVGHKEYPHSYELRGLKHDDITAIVKFIRTMKK